MHSLRLGVTLNFSTLHWNYNETPGSVSVPGIEGKLNMLTRDCSFEYFLCIS
jgi:phage host-nuclease inhibitor protein Gam